jgi:phosphoglucosamine mutase
VFAPGGSKLTDETQQRIEALWHAGERSEAASSATSAVTAVAANAPSVPSVSNEIADDYIAALTTTLDIAPFNGAKVVVDCANGATSSVVKRITEALGLNADLRNDAPNGRNINDGCGATHPDALASACAQNGVMGVAFDGDGDRLIAVDELGNVVDGDRLIALAAIDMHRRGTLAHDTVVVTSMTNLGFHRAMRAQHIATVITDVGDRAVLAAMEEGGFVLGGEQSGHIIHARHATTGDGVLSAMLLLDLVRRSGGTLSQLSAAVMTRLPQVLRNVRVTNKPGDIASLIADDLARELALLGDDGRIVVRASGTEPLVRIMVEAESQALADGVAARLEQAVIART